MKHENRKYRFAVSWPDTPNDVFGRDPIVFCHQWSFKHDLVFGLEFLLAPDVVPAAASRARIRRVSKRPKNIRSMVRLCKTLH